MSDIPSDYSGNDFEEYLKNESFFEQKNNSFKKSGLNLQCSVCLRIFTNSPDLFSHLKIHYEDAALIFLKNNQPLSGEILLAKFKNLDLIKLEKNKKIKFLDIHMTWVLYDYEFKSKYNEFKFKSIINAPCLNCTYEKSCKIDNPIINPLICTWIDNWVQKKPIKKRQIKKSVNHMETIKQAKLFLYKSIKFDIIGKLEKYTTIPTKKFLFIDAELLKIPIIFRIDDEKNLKSGNIVFIKNVILATKNHKLALNANKAMIKKIPTRSDPCI